MNINIDKKLESFFSNTGERIGYYEFSVINTPHGLVYDYIKDQCTILLTSVFSYTVVRDDYWHSTVEIGKEKGQASTLVDALDEAYCYINSNVIHVCIYTGMPEEEAKEKLKEALRDKIQKRDWFYDVSIDKLIEKIGNV